LGREVQGWRATVGRVGRVVTLVVARRRVLKVAVRVFRKVPRVVMGVLDRSSATRVAGRATRAATDVYANLRTLRPVGRAATGRAVTPVWDTSRFCRLVGRVGSTPEMPV